VSGPTVSWSALFRPAASRPDLRPGPEPVHELVVRQALCWAGRQAALPHDEPGAATRAPGSRSGPQPRSGHHQIRCPVARSRAFGRSLPSGSRAQPTSLGRSAPRGSCPYALTGAAYAMLASPFSGRVANTCPCAAPRRLGRGPSAAVLATPVLATALLAPAGLACAGSAGVKGHDWPTEPTVVSRPAALAPAAAALLLSGPCAKRVTRGGDDGSRPDKWRSATRMSSGRTAGVKCRTTIRSIAHPDCSPATARCSSSSDTTPSLVSSRLTPLLVRRSTSACSEARNARTADAASCGCTPGKTTCQTEASNRGAAVTAARSAASITSIPSGSAASSLLRTSSGSRAAVSAISRYSASLAAPVGAPPW
jgi:hypothetical protein